MGQRKKNIIKVKLIHITYIYIHRWGELESGQTTIAFTPLHQHETDDLTGKVQSTCSERERAPLEVCFCYLDVDAAFKVTQLIILVSITVIYIVFMTDIFDLC